MKNMNTDTLLTERIIHQLDQCETKIQADLKEMLKGQAEIQEMLKRFLLGQNTGAEVAVAEPNGYADEACIEEIDDVKEATLYFRVGGSTSTITFYGIEVGKWFSIPPPCDCVDSERCISPLFKEPPCDLGFHTTPLAIGHYIFLISDKMDVNSNSQPFRYVHYLNTQTVKETEDNPWKKASPLVGEHAHLCHFLVADDRIYAFGFLNKGNTLCVKYIDCHNPNQGWNVLYNRDDNVEPCSSVGALSDFSYVPASTIEFVTTDGEPGRRARRALIFSIYQVLTYDFDTSSYELSKLNGVFQFNEILCSLCPDGGLFYLLIQGFDDSFSLVVYNHHGRDRGFIKVFGLDDYLPEDYTEHFTPPVFRLVHLGNGRMCLVWPRKRGANTEVHCTKFIVEKVHRKYHATIVSSQVYTVKSFSLDNFEAVVM